jgi:carbamoyltransferase
VLLNTSFNVKGQPIVCTPDEALDTFLLAQLDLLVMGNLIVTADPRTADDDRRDASMRVVLGVG